jgi:hypothetical protein
MIWSLDQINIINEIEIEKKSILFIFIILRELSQFINMEGTKNWNI